MYVYLFCFFKLLYVSIEYTLLKCHHMVYQMQFHLKLASNYEKLFNFVVFSVLFGDLKRLFFHITALFQFY